MLSLYARLNLASENIKRANPHVLGIYREHAKIKRLKLKNHVKAKFKLLFTFAEVYPSTAA